MGLPGVARPTIPGRGMGGKKDARSVVPGSQNGTPVRHRPMDGGLPSASTLDRLQLSSEEGTGKIAGRLDKGRCKAQGGGEGVEKGQKSIVCQLQNSSLSD